VFTELAKSYHYHFCSNRDCREFYEDYRCEDVSKNGRCHKCRGLEKPLLYESRDPRPCCWGNTEVVLGAERIVRYRLAGPGPWFQCKTCARCHGWPCIPNERNS
jgi:hypothetical protein